MMSKNTEQLHLQDLADTTVINPVDANGARGLEGLGAFPPAGGDGFAGFTADGGDGGNMLLEAKKSHKGPIIVLVSIAVILVALIAVFFTMRWHYADRVAPGVSFGSVKVTGQTRGDLTATVNKAVKDSSIVVKGDNDRQISATLKDLGVSVDVKKTVDDLLAAKKSENLLQDIARVNPFSHESVKLAAKVNTYEMSRFLSDKLISDDERAVASSISYDANAQAFVVTEGRDGDTPDIQPVDAAVEQAIKNPGNSATVEITNKQVDMPITTEEAQKTADEANQRLTNKIVLTNGDTKQFELPVDEVAKWIKPNGDPSKGQITLDYDAVAIKTYLAAVLPQQLNQELVPQEDIVDDNNKVILDNANKLLQSIDSMRANIRTDKDIHNRIADVQRAFVQPHANIENAGKLASGFHSLDQAIGIVREINRHNLAKSRTLGRLGGIRRTHLSTRRLSNDAIMREIHTHHRSIRILFRFIEPRVHRRLCAGIDAPAGPQIYRNIKALIIASDI